MADPILVDEAWRTATYGLIAVIGAIVSWWIGKERPRLAKLFQAHEEALREMVKQQIKAQTKTAAYLKDMYDRLGRAFKLHEDIISHTEIDFNSDNHKDD